MMAPVQAWLSRRYLAQAARSWPSRVRADKRATTTVEFALVGTTFVAMTFGIIELGIITWSKAALQLTASLTARCGAEGAYGITACTSTANTQSYAVSLADTWFVSGSIATGNVTAVSGATTCMDVSGKFYSISITSTYLSGGWLPYPFANVSMTANSCYPMG